MSINSNKPNIYWIDIVGTCNLRCPSCPVGNYVENTRFKGLMELSFFEKLLKKIVAENEQAKTIGLFNWGEPFLHPKLPEFIKLINSYKLKSFISTNFNKTDTLEEVIKANPSQLRISLSGFKQESYKITHKNGNIEKIKINLFKLRKLLDKYHSKTLIEISFHIYKHNAQDDFLKMKKLSENLGFWFNPTWAGFSPMEKLLSYYEDKALLTQEDQNLIDLLLISPEEHKEIALKYKSEECILRSEQLVINADGSVPVCCTVYDKKYTISPNFLEESLLEIQNKRNKAEICKKCTSYGINTIYTLGGEQGNEELNKLGLEKMKALY